MKRGWIAAALAGVMAGLAGAEPPRYRMIPLAPSGGPHFSIAHPTDINNRCQIVGTTSIEVGGGAFVWSDGDLRELATIPGFGMSRAAAINDRGDIIGESRMQAFSPVRSTLWRGGTPIDLAARYGVGMHVYDIADSGLIAGARAVAGPAGFAPATFDDTGYHDLPSRPEWLGGSAMALNEAGLVAGWYGTGPGAYGPVLWSPDGLDELPVPDDLGNASAHGVNESGWIIGSGWNEVWEFGLLWRDGQVTRIGDPADGVRLSYPCDINDRGEILAYIHAGTTAGYYLWRDGVLTDIESLLEPGTPWRLVSAYSINNLGQIAGEAMIDGRQVGVLLDPIPAPGPLVLLGYAAARRRR